eukprot:4512676-Prymnesium_polylepis.1
MLERPPVRRDSSDPPHNAPRRSSEHGWRAWRRRSGVQFARRCTTACTARASFSGEPQGSIKAVDATDNRHQLRHLAPGSSGASQACSRVALAATFSRLVPAVRCA